MHTTKYFGRSYEGKYAADYTIRGLCKPRTACMNGTISSFAVYVSRERAFCKSCGRINGSVHCLYEPRIVYPRLIFSRVNARPTVLLDFSLSISNHIATLSSKPCSLEEKQPRSQALSSHEMKEPGTRLEEKKIA